MDAVCEECGDAGFRELLLRCSKCKNAARHRYCLDTVIFDLVGEWSCSGCIPKHNEADKSLEDEYQWQLSNIKPGCSMVNGPTVDKEKITKAWGLRAIRSHRKWKDCVGVSTKQFPSGDTSNWGQWRNEPRKERRDSVDAITAQFCSGDALDSCEHFVRDIPKEGEDRNGHLTCVVESFDSSSNLPLDHSSELEPNNLQKAMNGSKLVSNFTESTDLSNACSCFASSNYVEGLVPQGREVDIFSLTNNVEGSLPMILHKSRPTSASVEQASLSIKREKSEPLKAVTGLEKSVAASKFAPNHSKSMQGSDLKTGGADVLNPPKQRFDSCSLVPMQSSVSNELEDVAVQENSAERIIVDKSCPTLGSVEQAGLSIKREKSEPVKAVTGLEKGDVASKFAPNHSKPIKGSDKTGSADVLNPPKQSLDLWSMVPLQSSPSNELEDAAVQENSAERTRCLVNEETNAPTIGNLNISNPSMVNECVPNHSKPIKGSDLKTGNADVLNPPKQSLDSLSMVPMQSSPSNELEDASVQESSAERTRCLVDEETNTPTIGNLNISNPSMVNECVPNHSKPIQGSDLKTGSADVLNPPKQSLDSWSMVPIQSSASNELEDVAVQENGAERTRCLVDEETNTPTIGNLNISKPSMVNECVPSNEGNSDKANRKSDDVSLSTKAKNMQVRVSGDREIVNSYNVTGVSNPKSAKGDRDARNLKRNARKLSSLDLKKFFVKEVLQEEGINSELLSSSFVGPCEATKINPRKRKQSESCTPDGDQKATTENEIKTVNDAHSKGGRPAPAASASVRDGQNMSREDKGSNDKVIGRSKKRKYKKIESLLANKASRESRKRRGTVTSVLEPSSLHGSSVDKSRPCSENMNLPLKERICLLNHRCSKNRKKVKNKSMDANKDGNASVRNLDAGCAESDVSQLALETVVKNDYCGISWMPHISQCIDMQALDKPYWTGIMKIDKNYIPLAAHLSFKAGKEVQEQSRSLPPIMEVTKLSTSKTCPKHLEEPILSAGSIGLYFFSGDIRPNKELDELVKHVADSGIILEAIVGSAKLFLFPSFVLPEECRTFRDKPFLWGVFKPREEKIKRSAPVEQDCVAHTTKEDHVQEQRVLDQQDGAQGGTLDQVLHPENKPLLDANQVAGKETLSGNGLPLVDMKAIVSANISPADQGQPCSNPEAPPPKLCGIVVSRTPRSAQLIQELQKEGALLFAVQQVMTEPGSVV